ncbi:MAG: hypothetical protein HY059_03905 [Proteobacteria bacterium]|nr:hypothetical protein [Pseudomonadota bacterium]
MRFEELCREGSFPAIVPNAGQRRSLCWRREDAGRLGEELKKAFPNVLFFEMPIRCEYRPENPNIRFFDRLDDAAVDTSVTAVFPYPGWKPDLVFEKTSSTGRPFWHWAHYLSPIISFSINSYNRVNWNDWRGAAAEQPVENYFASDITTSYRRQLPEEARIQAKVVRLSDKMCTKVVAVIWRSYADFFAGRGEIWGKKKRLGILHVTRNVLGLYRAAPGRAIDLQVAPGGWGIGYLPVEEIPDSWWGDIPKPKWAQVPR